MHPGGPRITRPARGRRVRALARSALLLLLLPVLALLAVPEPGRSGFQRGCCRLLLRSLGIRITLSGAPIRNVPGVLVVSRHVSWTDIFLIGAVIPSSFVTKSEMIGWPGLGVLARMMKVIPIDRANLRRLPDVVAAVADRLRAGKTVVAFPEGTTWCGLASGRFHPAMFQAAIDSHRPVQPLRLSYHHRDGSLSTAASYIGDETLPSSLRRIIAARCTIVGIRVGSLQLPGESRRELAAPHQTWVNNTVKRNAAAPRQRSRQGCTESHTACSRSTRATRSSTRR